MNYDESSVVSLFNALKYERVSVLEIEPGDIVRVDDWNVVKIAEVKRRSVSKNFKSYPMWANAVHDIVLVDDRGAEKGWPDTSLVERIPRDFVKKEQW